MWAEAGIAHFMLEWWAEAGIHTFHIGSSVMYTYFALTCDARRVVVGAEAGTHMSHALVNMMILPCCQ